MKHFIHRFTGIIEELPLSESKRIHEEFWRHYNHNVTYDVSNAMKALEMKCLLVAKTGLTGINIGFTASYIDPTRRKGDELGVTVVKEGYRNQGVATALIKSRIYLRPWIVSHIQEDNVGSVRASERAGLEFSGEYADGKSIRCYKIRR
jgi:hypothetical protein